MILGHHIQHPLHGVVNYLFDVIPLVNFAFDDGPKWLEVFESRYYVVTDDEVVQVCVNAVAIGYD